MILQISVICSSNTPCVHGYVTIKAAKSFESMGKKFDPNFHQALNEVESEQEDGMIINEIQKGYMLNDRLLRPALVSISKKKTNTN